jgi:two-component system, OmpR family, sensor kinase
VDMKRRLRLRLGFRARVLGFTALLLAVAVVGGLVVQRIVLLERLESEVDAQLDEERSELELLADGRDPVTGDPFADDARRVFDTFLERRPPQDDEAFVTFVDGELYRPTPGAYRLGERSELVDRWARLEAGERGSLDTAAGPVRYLAVPLTAEDETRGVFLAAQFVRDQRAEVDVAVLVAAAVAGVVLLVATAAGWLVAGRLLQPVRRLTESARSISETDLSRRLPVEGDDEIAELTRTYNAMLDRLDAAFAAQREFVDDAGHELRTPITIVRGHLEVMGDDPAEQRETLTLVMDELDRMARIVNDLLVLAKAERPDFLVTEPTELSDLTTEILANARRLGDRRWTLESQAAGAIDVDPQRLKQAMLNLARNAVEHTEPGAVIGIGSAWGSDGARLWVRDTGSGIDADEQRRIFDRFSRGRDGRRRSEGAGLGLAIVRAIAAAHGGTVGVTSTRGVGSTFTLRLPGTSPSSGPSGVTTDAGADPAPAPAPVPAGVGQPPAGNDPAAGEHTAVGVSEDRTWPAS